MTRTRRVPALVAVVALAITATTGLVTAQSPAAPTGLKATYVSSGPIGVNPFLQLIQQGLERAGTEFGVETSVVESTDAAALADNLRFAVEEGNDLIVANSFDSIQAIAQLGTEYPDQKWALVDVAREADPGLAPLTNLRGMVFREHEGAYLLGAIVGLLATGNYEGYPASDVIGAVGAIDLPFIRRWYVGFEEGVTKVNPDATLDLRWATGFTDPAGSKELALAEHAAGANYVFAFSAAGNTGIFEAARDEDFFTTGVDTDQRSLDPDHIVESVVKRTDIGVYEAVRDLAQGTFVGGTQDYGLSENGVGPAFLILDDPQPPVTLPQDVQDQVRALAEQIVSGEIVVTDYLAQPAPSPSASQ
jgi:basic membrane protein A